MKFIASFSAAFLCAVLGVLAHEQVGTVSAGVGVGVGALWLFLYLIWRDAGEKPS